MTDIQEVIEQRQQQEPFRAALKGGDVISETVKKQAEAYEKETGKEIVMFYEMAGVMTYYYFMEKEIFDTYKGNTYKLCVSYE